MTTIAWDGKTLAADRKCSQGSFQMPVTKIWRLKNGWLLGGAGTLADVIKVREWVERGMRAQSKPDVSDVTVLVVKKDGTVWELEENLVPIPIEAKCHAIGSGMKYALAAMYCGKTASDAVEIASHFDPLTGLGVVTLLPVSGST